MVRRILLPVDGSVHGRKAAALAGVLASLYGAEVVLLHVLDPDRASEGRMRMAEVEHRTTRDVGGLPWVANVPGELMAMLQPPESSGTKEQALHYLAEKVVKAATDIVEREGVPDERIRVVFRDGRPSKRILESASDHDADMIVMGSRGLGTAGGFILGSVSQRVAAAAPCTVVTAR